MTNIINSEQQALEKCVLNYNLQVLRLSSHFSGDLLDEHQEKMSKEKIFPLQKYVQNNNICWSTFFSRILIYLV